MIVRCMVVVAVVVAAACGSSQKRASEEPSAEQGPVAQQVIIPVVSDPGTEWTVYGGAKGCMAAKKSTCNEEVQLAPCPPQSTYAVECPAGMGGEEITIRTDDGAACYVDTAPDVLVDCPTYRSPK